MDINFKRELTFNETTITHFEIEMHLVLPLD